MEAADAAQTFSVIAVRRVSPSRTETSLTPPPDVREVCSRPSSNSSKLSAVDAGSPSNGRGRVHIKRTGSMRGTGLRRLAGPGFYDRILHSTEKKLRIDASGVDACCRTGGKQLWPPEAPPQGDPMQAGALFPFISRTDGEPCDRKHQKYFMLDLAEFKHGKATSDPQKRGGSTQPVRSGSPRPEYTNYLFVEDGKPIETDDSNQHNSNSGKRGATDWIGEPIMAAKAGHADDDPAAVAKVGNSTSMPSVIDPRSASAWLSVGLQVRACLAAGSKVAREASLVTSSIERLANVAVKVSAWMETTSDVMVSHFARYLRRACDSVIALERGILLDEGTDSEGLRLPLLPFASDIGHTSLELGREIGAVGRSPSLVYSITRLTQIQDMCETWSIVVQALYKQLGVLLELGPAACAVDGIASTACEAHSCGDSDVRKVTVTSVLGLTDRLTQMAAHLTAINSSLECELESGRWPSLVPSEERDVVDAAMERIATSDTASTDSVEVDASWKAEKQLCPRERTGTEQDVPSNATGSGSESIWHKLEMEARAGAHSPGDIATSVHSQPSHNVATKVKLGQLHREHRFDSSTDVWQHAAEPVEPYCDGTIECQGCTSHEVNVQRDVSKKEAGVAVGLDSGDLVSSDPTGRSPAESQRRSQIPNVRRSSVDGASCNCDSMEQLISRVDEIGKLLGVPAVHAAWDDAAVLLPDASPAAPPFLSQLSSTAKVLNQTGRQDSQLRLQGIADLGGSLSAALVAETQPLPQQPRDRLPVIVSAGSFQPDMMKSVPAPLSSSTSPGLRTPEVNSGAEELQSQMWFRRRRKRVLRDRRLSKGAAGEELADLAPLVHGQDTTSVSPASPSVKDSAYGANGIDMEGPRGHTEDSKLQPCTPQEVSSTNAVTQYLDKRLAGSTRSSQRYSDTMRLPARYASRWRSLDSTKTDRQRGARTETSLPAYYRKLVLPRTGDSQLEKLQ